MKEFYTVNIDTNNYVLSISHTSIDNIELDLSKYDLKYINAYKLIDGELVLDEAKKQELIDTENKRKETPTQLETIEAQVIYTALMTDTMLEE